MRPFQIYRLKALLGNCMDPRPWIVVQLRPNNMNGCFPISTQCYSADCFPLSVAHPDFKATGLTRNSYIICTRIYALYPEEFELDGRQQLKGELLGKLLSDFRKFAGV